MNKPSEYPISFQQKHDNLEQSLANIRNNRYPLTIITDRLTDPANVGSLFRLADAARLKELIFFTDSEFEITPKINKIARQTVQYVPHRIVHNLNDLKNIPFAGPVCALEYTNQSTSIYDIKERPVALILGNEKFGIQQDLLNWADASIHLPMEGINSSMNVSMAAGIVVYWIRGRCEA